MYKEIKIKIKVIIIIIASIKIKAKAVLNLEKKLTKEPVVKVELK